MYTFFNLKYTRGSISNLMALLCAREQHFPHVRQEGWRPDDKAVGFAPA
jgi:hypothetical protein